MVCSISCMISAVSIIGMIYFYNATGKSEIVRNYKQTLSPRLQKKYEDIVQERTRISIQGYVLGFFISLIIIAVNLKMQPKKASLSAFPLACIILATSFITNYFYYILHPKTDNMINHLVTKEEINAWQTMYREMQYNYHLGFLLGIVAVTAFSTAFRC